MVTHGGVEPPTSRPQTERDTITLMSVKPGCAWRIRARVCRRDIADEPVARIATLARISWQFSIVRWLWITDGGRLERDGEAQLGYLRLKWSHVGCAWMIRVRICRREIADEPVARIAMVARIGRDFILR